MRTAAPTSPEQILAALAENGGDVKAAAKALDVSERTLYRRMREAGIRRQPVYETEAA